MPIIINNLDDAIQTSFQASTEYAIHEAPDRYADFTVITNNRLLSNAEKWRQFREKLAQYAASRLSEMDQIFNFLLQRGPSFYPHDLLGYQHLLNNIFDPEHYRTWQLGPIKTKMENSQFYQKFLPIVQALAERPDYSAQLAEARARCARLQADAAALDEARTQCALLQAEKQQWLKEQQTLTATVARRAQEARARQQILENLQPDLLSTNIDRGYYQLGRLLAPLISKLKERELKEFKFQIANALYPPASRISDSAPGLALLELEAIHTPEALAEWIMSKTSRRPHRGSAPAEMSRSKTSTVLAAGTGTAAASSKMAPSI